ncbi:hypothetical protein ABPG77_005496 [Micractinium sp. CCAP 211/92]
MLAQAATAGLRFTVRAARPYRPTAVRAMASAAPANSYTLLQYSYVPDILEKRGPYREQHLAGANKMAEQQKLVMAGALAEPVDGAVFIFRNVSKEDVEAFVAADPYKQNGLITSYSVRPYMVVAGDSS